MKVKMQTLKAGWCAEAEVNGETYGWECWGYSRAEARREAVKEFAKAARRDAANERARRGNHPWLHQRDTIAPHKTIGGTPMTPTTGHLKYGGAVQRLTHVCEASCPPLLPLRATYYKTQVEISILPNRKDAYGNSNPVTYKLISCGGGGGGGRGDNASGQAPVGATGVKTTSSGYVRMYRLW
jgi:hypothetical protein